MRHRRTIKKLGRSSAHRKALLSSLVCNLILHKRIKTTVTKAKLASRLADRMMTLGKKADKASSAAEKLAYRRRAIAILQQKPVVKELFDQLAPQYAERNGGYTRVIKLGRRSSDGSEMAYLEFVAGSVPKAAAKKDEPAAEEPATSEA